MRRRFEHLVIEISVRVGSRIPRYALWLRLHEVGYDPDTLTRAQALAFCREHLDPFLAAHELRLPRPQVRKLERAIARHDPSVRTPYEWVARL